MHPCSIQAWMPATIHGIVISSPEMAGVHSLPMEPTSTGQPPQAPLGAPSLQPIAPKPRRNNRMSSLIAVAVVAVIALGGYGISTVHAQSAPATLKTFYNDFFSYKFDD